MPEPGRIDPVTKPLHEGGIVPGFAATPERREKTAKDVARVAGITAGLGVLLRAVPHPAPKTVALFLAGLHKDSKTGALKVTPGTAGNLAPVPFGFAHPDTYGLKNNFYLPAGSSALIPKAADRIGLGLPEQRADDEAARLPALIDEAGRIRQAAVGTVRGASTDVLQQIVAGPAGATRAAELVATSGVGLPAVQSAAREELAARGVTTGAIADIAGAPVGAPVRLVPPVVLGVPIRDPGRGVVDSASVALLDFDPGGSDKTFSVIAVPPNNAAAFGNAERAEGIRKELITERADP